MQKYVVVEIITQADGRIAAPVNAFDTEEEAKSKFHAVMTQAYKSSYPVHACVALASNGFSIMDECVMHEPTPEPEQNENEGE